MGSSQEDWISPEYDSYYSDDSFFVDAPEQNSGAVDNNIESHKMDDSLFLGSDIKDQLSEINPEENRISSPISDSITGCENSSDDEFSPQPGGINHTEPTIPSVPDWIFKLPDIERSEPQNARESIEFDDGQLPDPDHTYEIDGWDTLLDEQKQP